MAASLVGKITTDEISRVFETLPSGTRNTLGEYGTPQQWAGAINAQLISRKGLPANFDSMEPSLQVSFLVQQVVASGNVPSDGPRDPARAAERFGQALGTAITARSPVSAVKRIESLIADGDAARANDTHFLKRTPLGG